MCGHHLGSLGQVLVVCSAGREVLRSELDLVPVVPSAWAASPADVVKPFPSTRATCVARAWVFPSNQAGQQDTVPASWHTAGQDTLSGCNLCSSCLPCAGSWLWQKLGCSGM